MMEAEVLIEELEKFVRHNVIHHASSEVREVCLNILLKIHTAIETKDIVAPVERETDLRLQ